MEKNDLFSNIPDDVPDYSWRFYLIKVLHDVELMNMINDEENRSFKRIWILNYDNNVYFDEK